MTATAWEALGSGRRLGAGNEAATGTSATSSSKDGGEGGESTVADRREIAAAAAERRAALRTKVSTKKTPTRPKPITGRQGLATDAIPVAAPPASPATSAEITVKTPIVSAKVAAMTAATAAADVRARAACASRPPEVDPVPTGVKRPAALAAVSGDLGEAPRKRPTIVELEIDSD